MIIDLITLGFLANSLPKVNKYLHSPNRVKELKEKKKEKEEEKRRKRTQKDWDLANK